MVVGLQIVLLDVHAGSVDGLTVSRSVTSRLLQHLCPYIILMSSDPLACQQDTASSHGAHAFLLKPLKRADLKSCLDKVKNRKCVGWLWRCWALSCVNQSACPKYKGVCTRCQRFDNELQVVKFNDSAAGWQGYHFLGWSSVRFFCKTCSCQTD